MLSSLVFRLPIISFAKRLRDETGKRYQEKPSSVVSYGAGVSLGVGVKVAVEGAPSTEKIPTTFQSKPTKI